MSPRPQRATRNELRRMLSPDRACPPRWDERQIVGLTAYIRRRANAIASQYPGYGQLGRRHRGSLRSRVSEPDHCRRQTWRSRLRPPIAPEGPEELDRPLPFIWKRAQTSSVPIKRPECLRPFFMGQGVLQNSESVYDDLVGSLSKVGWSVAGQLKLGRRAPRRRSARPRIHHAALRCRRT